MLNLAVCEAHCPLVSTLGEPQIFNDRFPSAPPAFRESVHCCCAQQGFTRTSPDLRTEERQIGPLAGPWIVRGGLHSSSEANNTGHHAKDLQMHL